MMCIRAASAKSTNDKHEVLLQCTKSHDVVDKNLGSKSLLSFVVKVDENVLTPGSSSHRVSLDFAVSKDYKIAGKHMGQ